MPPFGRAVGVCPLSAVMFHRYAVRVVGFAFSITHDALQDFAHYAWQSAAVNGDTFTHAFFCAAGAYTLNLLGVTMNASGKVDWYIDDVLVVAGQDWYSVGAVYNVVKTAAVAVASSGQHVLRGVVNGQNVASGGYRLYLTAIALV
jgi:hypothetical protein